MIDKKIIKKDNCVGCYACVNTCPINCILMVIDEEGFWYPKVDYDKCIECQKCIKVCPTINYKHIEKTPIAYACINKDESTRIRSSSGGIFTVIAELIIKNGGVVFGARFNENFQVVHSYTENIEELEEFRGSKYVQSEMGNIYKQVRCFLEEDRQVLFTGTPCQVAGLKNFLEKSYEKLICIDIICHGVPSPAVWKKYIEYREQKAGSSVKRIAFRLKNEGWKRYSVSFVFMNDTEYRKSFREDLYMKAFLKDICLRPSCYNCRFKTLNRQSDITLADFWGIQNILPEMDDDKGTSLVLVNSVVGESIFKKIKDNILYKEVDIMEAINYNPPAVKSAKPHSKRREFFYEIKLGVPFDTLVQKYCTDKIFMRIKTRFKIVLALVLERLGLLNMVKSILKR